MPAFNLSWRGSARGHPNIRLAPNASAEQPAPVPNPVYPSTRANEDILKRTLSPHMSKLRQAQQALVGRRRRVNNRNSKVRVSFQRSSTSSGLRPSTTRTSIRVPNSPSDTGECMSWVPSQTPRRRDAAPVPPVRRGGRQRANESSQQISGSQHLAKLVKPAAEGEDVRYSLMQVPEGSGSHVLKPQRKDEYAHVGSLDGSAMEFSKIPPLNSRRHGKYIVRAPPSRRRVNQQDVPEAVSPGIPQRQQTSARPQKDQQPPAVLDPLLDKTLQRSLSQQDRLSCISRTTKTKSRASTALPPSGNHQSRSLSRFTKELERYSMASTPGGQARMLPSTPTVSESPTTMDTLTDLLPYHRQFKAAGLAVTSREQMPRIRESGPTCVNKVGDATMAVMQVDGSNVTPSEKQSASQERVAPEVPDKEDGLSTSRPKPRASVPDSGPAIKSFLPWFRKEPRPPVSRTHSDRKFSKDHIHPSPPTPAEPFLTLEDKLGRLDSYFNAPKSKTPQHLPDLHNTSSASPIPGARRTVMDKPLPRKPPTKRRPIPARSGRRHMENTAHWPTAGVLIHDHYTSPPGQDELPVLSSDRRAVPAKGSVSAQSWTSHEEVLQEPCRSPPSPPGKEGKPEARPKDLPPKEDKYQSAQPLQPEGSSYNKCHKVTGLRRRSTTKPHPAPTTIRNEAETIPTEARQPNSKSDVSPELASAPQLQITLPGSSSSFEKALDAVISKLDAMEERRRYERNQDIGGAQGAALNTAPPEHAILKSASLKRSSAPRSQYPTFVAAQTTETTSSDAMEVCDSDINDRDILVGLKMAICAACDEDLDAWIRNKTGLRLRRFLADLRAFEAVSRERVASGPPPLSRRIRTHDKESRRLEFEQERRKRVSKKWAPCFGADGQDMLPEASQEM